MKRALVAPFVVLVALAFGASCKDPTQVVVEARTNVAFRGGMVTTFTVGSPGQTERADPTTETRDPWDASGFIGSLVVVPGSADDAALSVKLVLAIDRDPRACTAENGYAGCIVARRRLRYSPHARLRLPMTLYAACIGVPCDESSTCSALGTCVPAEVVSGSCESAGGCVVIGDDSTGALDASVGDATTDGAPNDGSSNDGASDAGKDAVTPDASDAGSGTPGTIDCRSITCPTANGGHCCYDTASDVASGCASNQMGCAAGGTVIDIRCDDDSDCSNGNVCCWGTSGQTFSCETPSSCAASAQRVCHVSKDACPGTCTGKVDGYYSVCE